MHSIDYTISADLEPKERTLIESKMIRCSENASQQRLKQRLDCGGVRITQKALSLSGVISEREITNQP